MSAPAIAPVDLAVVDGIRDARPGRESWRVTDPEADALASLVLIMAELEAEGLWPLPYDEGERVAVYVRLSADLKRDSHGVVRDAVVLMRRVLDRGWLPVIDPGTGYPLFGDNNISASDLAWVVRPSFDRMLAECATGAFDHLLATDLDRWTRRPDQVAAFQNVRLFGRVLGADGVRRRSDRPVPFKLHLGGASYDLAEEADYMTLHYQVGAAAKASKDTSRRLKANNDDVRRQGKPTGGPAPFGLKRVDGTYVVDEHPAALLRNAAERLVAGTVSLTRLAVEWETLGVPRTRGGKGWSAALVRSYLTRPSLAGDLVSKGHVVQRDAWPAVYDRALWEALKLKLDAIAEPHRGPRNARLWGGLIVCAEHGVPLVGVAGGNWACRNVAGAVGHLTVAGKLVEPWALDAFREGLEYLRDNPPPERTDDGDNPELDAARAELARHDKRLAELVDTYTGGTADDMTLGEYRDLKRRIEAARKPAATRVAELEGARVQRKALKLTGDPLTDWEAIDFDMQRAWLASVVERIAVGAGVPGRNRWTPEQLDARFEVTYRTAPMAGH